MKICPKCQNANLADALSELDNASDETEWWKCFKCGWRGRPIMGRPTVTEREIEPGDATAIMQDHMKRHCHAPGRKHQFCSQRPLFGEDYCRKHMVLKHERSTEKAEQPEQAVSHRPSVVVGALMPATDLDHAIGQLTGDLAVLQRAREIVNRMQG